MSSAESQGLVSRAPSGERDRDDLDALIEELEGEDPSFRGALDDADARRALVRSLINLRQAAGLTQSALAAGMATTQSAVSELEGGATDPRLSTLQRYARAAGSKITVTVEPSARVLPGVAPWTERVTLSARGTQTSRIVEAARLPSGLATQSLPGVVTYAASTAESVRGNEPSLAA